MYGCHIFHICSSSIDNMRMMSTRDQNLARSNFLIISFVNGQQYPTMSIKQDRVEMVAP